jgi:hypothetical protein
LRRIEQRRRQLTFDRRCRRDLVERRQHEWHGRFDVERRRDCDRRCNNNWWRYGNRRCNRDWRYNGNWRRTRDRWRDRNGRHDRDRWDDGDGWHVG